MAEQSLKDKTVKGVGWTAIESVLRYGVSFVVGVILARLLSPDEYGLIGILTRTTNFMYEMQEAPNPRYLLGDGEKTDISNMVEFLLSDKSRWVTGQEFVVDGGLTIN